jgi:trehalose 6-phosphate phosphatase
VTKDLVAEFASRGRDAALFLDFDGTLSEIVELPHHARPFSGVREVLEDLGHYLGLVAIVSGRSASQLLEWLGPGIELWGVHGAERTVDGRIELTDAAKPHAELMASVLEEARSALHQLALPGVVIEDKTIMIGLHFRAANDRGRARAALDSLAQELADRHGLLRAGGRLAFELRPPQEFSKAAVVRDRAKGFSAAGFFGDDVVDLPGFDALDELAGTDVVTLRVAVSSSEAPEELLRRADVVVDGPQGVVGLLRRIAELAASA